jgi:hypothetical protein
MTGHYQYPTVEYEHPNSRLRSATGVAVRLQMAADERVAGARIEVA